jgi:hypothetical protein
MQLSHQEKVVELKRNQEKELEKYQDHKKTSLIHLKKKWKLNALKHGVFKVIYKLKGNIIYEKTDIIINGRAQVVEILKKLPEDHKIKF